MSALAEPTERTPARAPLSAPITRTGSTPDASERMWLWLITGLTAAVMCTITFSATGGLNLETMTFTEMALTLGSAALGGRRADHRAQRSPALRHVADVLPAGADRADRDLVAWSVQPDESWRDAGRMLAYSAVFGGSLALVRIAPTRWPAILGGLVLASVLVCGYALLTKIFPASLDATDTYARLQEPFGYWNAVGLTAPWERSAVCGWERGERAMPSSPRSHTPRWGCCC